MQNNTKPNIIYILGDDHRQEFSEMEGYKYLKTPNLADLSKNGYYFENSFCTSPCCTPSRACHYTGLWERAHGINFNSETAVSRKAWQETFPMILKQNGYQTAWIGKNHVPVGEKGYPTHYMEQTFDYWYGNHNHSFFYPKEHPNRGEIYENAKYDTQIEVFEEGAMNFLDPQKDFIESCSYPLTYRDKSKPFCMCVTFNLPHGASTGGMDQRPTDDEIYKSLYRDKIEEIPIPKSYIAYDDIKEPRLPKWLYSGDYLKEYDYVKTIPDLKERIIRICQTVTGMDRMIGHLRDKLNDLGIADNTIIIFSTDHGIHHGEHGLGGKCFLYEEDLRIPLIIYDPREKSNSSKRIKEMVAVPDLAPTVLEMAGISVPPIMQGKSLVPLMHGDNHGWRKELLVEQHMDTQNYCKSEAVCTEEWKYIRYFARTEISGNTLKFKTADDNYTEFLLNSWDENYKPVAYEELFHLSEDKYEEVNLASDKNYENTLNYFRKRIREMIKEKLVPNHAERVCQGAVKVLSKDIHNKMFE